MEMTWTTFVAASESIASFAVVISLIYLAIQVRLQAKANETAIISSLTQQWGEAVQAFATHEDLYRIWMKGLVDFDGLSPEERGRFSAILVNLTQIFECLFLHYREGKVDADLWRGFDSRLRDVFATTGVQSWWRLRCHWHTQAFQQYANEAIARSKDCDGRYMAVYGKKTTDEIR